MALTFATRPVRQNWVMGGGKRETVTLVTLDASYPTGGYTITNQQLGFAAGATLDKVTLSAAGGYVFEWIFATNKLKAYSGVATEAAANLAGLNGVVVRIYALGN